MNTLASIQELARAIRNMIRTGIIVETDLTTGRCRVQTGGIYTDWLQWLTHRAGRSRTWWAPSVGEQVMILAVGGELDTAFVLPGIYSDDNPAPSASTDAWHVEFPDGAVMSYEPETGALTVTGIKTADVTASGSVAVIRLMADQGRAWPLLDGTGTIYGMYVINNISETGSLFFADGTPRKIDFTLTLTRVDESLAALYGDIGEQAKSQIGKAGNMASSVAGMVGIG